MQFGAFEDTDHVALIIEYAAKGDLFDLLRHMGGRMKEADVVARIMTPFMKGLAYMHSLGVIHRDIKLENTLFSVDGTLKIADFGLSVDANHEAPVTRLGTLDYMSPGAPCIRHACSGPPAATRSTRAYPVLHLRSGCGMHATAQPPTRPSPHLTKPPHQTHVHSTGTRTGQNRFGDTPRLTDACRGTRVPGQARARREQAVVAPEVHG